MSHTSNLLVLPSPAKHLLSGRRSAADFHTKPIPSGLPLARPNGLLHSAGPLRASTRSSVELHDSPRATYEAASPCRAQSPMKERPSAFEAGLEALAPLCIPESPVYTDRAEQAVYAAGACVDDSAWPTVSTPTQEDDGFTSMETSLMGLYRVIERDPYTLVSDACVNGTASPAALSRSTSQSNLAAPAADTFEALPALHIVGAACVDDGSEWATDVPVLRSSSNNNTYSYSERFPLHLVANACVDEEEQAFGSPTSTSASAAAPFSVSSRPALSLVSSAMVADEEGDDFELVIPPSPANMFVPRSVLHLVSDACVDSAAADESAAAPATAVSSPTFRMVDRLALVANAAVSESDSDSESATVVPAAPQMFHIVERPNLHLVSAAAVPESDDDAPAAAPTTVPTTFRVVARSPLHLVANANVSESDEDAAPATSLPSPRTSSHRSSSKFTMAPRLALSLVADACTDLGYPDAPAPAAVPAPVPTFRPTLAMVSEACVDDGADWDSVAPEAISTPIPTHVLLTMSERAPLTMVSSACVSDGSGDEENTPVNAAESVAATAARTATIPARFLGYKVLERMALHLASTACVDAEEDLKFAAGIPAATSSLSVPFASSAAAASALPTYTLAGRDTLMLVSAAVAGSDSE